MNEFKILSQFLDSFEGETEGRATHDLSDDERGMLTRIADGSSTSADRDTALSVLVENRTAMEYLAGLLREAA
jgi:hypothetical protein